MAGLPLGTRAAAARPGARVAAAAADHAGRVALEPVRRGGATMEPGRRRSAVAPWPLLITNRSRPPARGWSGLTRRKARRKRMTRSSVRLRRRGEVPPSRPRSGPCGCSRRAGSRPAHANPSRGSGHRPPAQLARPRPVPLPGGEGTASGAPALDSSRCSSRHCHRLDPSIAADERRCEVIARMSATVSGAEEAPLDHGSGSAGSV